MGGDDAAGLAPAAILRARHHPGAAVTGAVPADVGAGERADGRLPASAATGSCSPSGWRRSRSWSRWSPTGRTSTAGNLSGGQRRMVEIARCLMLDPKAAAARRAVARPRPAQPGGGRRADPRPARRRCRPCCSSSRTSGSASDWPPTAWYGGRQGPAHRHGRRGHEPPGDRQPLPRRLQRADPLRGRGGRQRCTAGRRGGGPAPVRPRLAPEASPQQGSVPAEAHSRLPNVVDCGRPGRGGVASGGAHHGGGVQAEVGEQRPGGVAARAAGHRAAGVAGRAGEVTARRPTSGRRPARDHLAVGRTNSPPWQEPPRLRRVAGGDVDRRLRPHREHVACGQPAGARARPGPSAPRRARRLPRPTPGRRRGSYGATVRILNVPPPPGARPGSTTVGRRRSSQGSRASGSPRRTRRAGRPAPARVPSPPAADHGAGRANRCRP